MHRTHHDLGFGTPRERAAARQLGNERAEDAVWQRPYAYEGLDLAMAIRILEQAGIHCEVRAGRLHCGLSGRSILSSAEREAHQVLDEYTRVTGADVSELRASLPLFAKVTRTEPAYEWVRNTEPGQSRHVRRPVLRGHHDLFVDGELVLRDGVAVELEAA